MKKISAVLITYNEEEKIERALKSLEKVSDEILVVDSYSTDSTPEICRQYATRLIQRSWQGYRIQKQFATEQAQYSWILNLDADEILSPELAQEILTWKNLPSLHQGYFFPRKTFFMGRWISHTTWYPDWQLRLFKRNYGCWKGGRVHEFFQVAGSTAKFNGRIYHHTYSSSSEYLQQLDNFSALAARDYLDHGKKTSWHHFCLYPPAVFLKNYVIKLGFLDGIPGLFVSILAAISTLFKYWKLWELQSQTKSKLSYRFPK